MIITQKSAHLSVRQRGGGSMRMNRSHARVRALCCVLLLALLLGLCGSMLWADHACDDPCCVLCRFAELRRQLIWATLFIFVAALGPGRFHRTGVRPMAIRRRSFTLVSYAVQLND